MPTEHDLDTAGDVDYVAADQLQRCSLKHAQEARKNYCGTVRAPLHGDELGAVNVVELQFEGARVAFFRIADSTVCEVRRLPKDPPAAAAPVQAAVQRLAPRLRARSAGQPAGPLFGGRK